MEALLYNEKSCVYHAFGDFLLVDALLCALLCALLGSDVLIDVLIVVLSAV